MTTGLRRSVLFLLLITGLGLTASAVAARDPDDAVPAAGAAVPAPGNGVVALRHDVVVGDGLIRLGDLFDSAGEAADTPIAYAPRPGRRAVFDARWLWRVARAYGLDWRPVSRHDRVIVERDAIVVSRSEVQALVLTALEETGIEIANARVHLANSRFEIALANDPSADLIVDDVVFDARQHRFVASLVARDPGSADRRFRLAGRLEPMTDVPVPVRRLGAGAVVEAADLTWVSMPSQRVQRDTVIDADQLIGMMSRRPLPEGAPVRAGDLSEPVLIARGEPVTIVLAARHMLLTARGRALEDGSEGAVIRVANAQSRTVIEAAVTGPGRVEVDLGAATTPMP